MSNFHTTCGQHFKHNLVAVPLHKLKRPASAVSKTVEGSVKKVFMYSAYVGKVPLLVLRITDSRYAMQSSVVLGRRTIYAKVLDCQQLGLSPTVYSYPVLYLKTLNPVQLDTRENEYYYYAKLTLAVKIAQIQKSNTLTQTRNKLALFLNTITASVEKTRLARRFSNEFPTSKIVLVLQRQLQSVLVRLVAVDILFSTVQYLNFIYSRTKLVGLQTNEPYLFGLYNVPNLDNAFYAGDGIMAYGNGDSMFYPLASMDVIGHELGHGITDAIGGLEYKGHSGALDESLADILGTMFEFYAVQKFKLETEADFLIGEDIGRTKYIRNMMNPLDCRQPNCLNGQYYIDPTIAWDNGGVHINSGIINYCFYLLCETLKSREEAFNLMFSCFKQTCIYSRTSTFQDFGRIAQTTFLGRADATLTQLKIHPDNFEESPQIKTTGD